MTTDTKPTQEQIARLENQLLEVAKMIGVMIAYHNKRADFFNIHNFVLNIINALVGVGALSLIGWQLAEQTDPISSIKTSLGAATLTVLLLFFGMLLDFARKEEKHRWLATIYRSYNKELSDIPLIAWDNLTKEDYGKIKILNFKLKDGMNCLKKEEFPILEFDFFLCGIKEKITEKKEGSVFLKVTFLQRWLANYFSMTNARARFLAKYNNEARQKDKQQNNKKPHDAIVSPTSQPLDNRRNAP